MAIFTHVTVGTNDLAKARAFYDAVLAPLGCKRLKDFGDGGSCWGQTTEEFMVLKPADGKPASVANGGTISFEAPSRAAVAAFHKAALAAGGKDEGAVGPRSFWPHAYAGYVRDLDGNKLAVYCRKPEQSPELLPEHVRTREIVPPAPEERERDAAEWVEGVSGDSLQLGL